MKRQFSASIGIGLALAAAGLLAATTVYAATPTYSLVSVGGDSVQVNVTGDANSAVMLYYNVGSSGGLEVTTLGTTNSGGTFSTTISASSYNIIGGDQVYFIVNSQQSALQTWPTSGSVDTSAPILSQNSVTLGLGQSVTITSENNASVYLTSNTSPSIASISTNGTQITITGEGLGTTIASICLVGTSSNCTNISATVQSTDVSTSGSSVIFFSQNNFSLSTGGSEAVTVSGGNGVYDISSNSNSSVISTSLSGNTLTVFGLTNGNATLNVCDQSGNCGQLDVTVGASSGSSGSVIFGENNPTITQGQNTTIALSGASSYFVSSNSNANIVEASVNGSALTLYGTSIGSDSLTVCGSGGGCSTLFVTVEGATSVVGSSPIANSSVLAEIQSLESTMTQVLSQVQSMESQLAQLVAQVNASSPTTVSAPTTGTYDFTELLTVGLEDAQVTELQNRLTTLGFYSGPITGFYGTETEQAVEAYQTKHGIEAVGYVGPSTRAALNAGE